MFNSNDIYSHLLNGGDKQILFDALMQEITKAEEKVKATKEVEKKEKELANKINKARSAAIKAMKSYFALVNPKVDDKMINIALDTLESIEITIEKDNTACGERAKTPSILDERIFFTDEEIKDIWNSIFPIHFKKK